MKSLRIVCSVVFLIGGALQLRCKDTNVQNGCHQDSDCGTNAAAFRCDTDSNTCFCRTDDACKASEFCNPAGFCQARAGCEKNSDCTDPTQFCDTNTGTCLPKGRCTMDLHCPLGSVCDVDKSVCVLGCRGNGDCNGSSCLCGTKACGCSGTTPEERAQCAIGTCDPNFCADKSYCKFGEKCGTAASTGTDVPRCYNDYDSTKRPYCANCTTNPAACGTGSNFCLLDNVHPGSLFCGVDCSGGQTCPRGYECGDVIVVSKNKCTRANPTCPTNTALLCQQDADCDKGGLCVKSSSSASTGYCSGRCDMGEADVEGYCSCQTDTDCAQETCSLGTCTITKKACTTSADCKPIHCVVSNGVGRLLHWTKLRAL